VAAHIVIFNNPSLFQADDLHQIRLFLLNGLLLACVWSEIHFGKRVKQLERELKAQDKHDRKVKGAQAHIEEQAPEHAEGAQEAHVQQKKSKEDKNKKKR
jgi:hypothetical protein